MVTSRMRMGMRVRGDVMWMMGPSTVMVWMDDGDRG